MVCEITNMKLDESTDDHTVDEAMIGKVAKVKLHEFTDDDNIQT